MTEFVITGMHRSGTSLFASILQGMGIDIGSSLLESAPDNKNGFFEDEEFFRFQDDVLLRNGTDYLVFDIESFVFDKDEVKTAEDLIKARSDTKKWGWKDPRTTLFLEEWDKILSDPIYMFVYRHPFAVVTSLLNRAGPPVLNKIEHLFDVWYLYNRKLIEFYKKNKGRCYLFHIDGVVNDFQKFCHLVEKDINVDSDIDINNFFNPTLMRDISYPKHFIDILQKEYPKVMGLYNELQEISDISFSEKLTDDSNDFLGEIFRVFKNTNHKWSGYLRVVNNANSRVNIEPNSNKTELEILRIKYNSLLDSKAVRFSNYIKRNKTLHLFISKLLKKLISSRSLTSSSKQMAKGDCVSGGVISNKNGTVGGAKSKKEVPKKLDKIILYSHEDTEYMHQHDGFDDVVHLYFDKMFGVQSAVAYLPGHKAKLPLSDNEIDISRLTNYINNNQIKTIILHGYWWNVDDLLLSLRQENGSSIKIMVVWHGNTSQFSEKIVLKSFNRLVELKKVGVIDEIASVKPTFELLDTKTVFHKPMYNLPPNVQYNGKIKLNNELFIPLRSIHRKNLYSNIYTALSNNKVTSVQYTHQFEFLELLDGNTSKLKLLNNGKGLSRENVFETIKDSNLILNITLSECQPMVFLESLAYKVPCLIGPNNFGELDNMDYKKLVEVTRPDDLHQINNKINRLLDMTRNNQSELNEMMSSYKQQLYISSISNYLELINT